MIELNEQDLISRFNDFENPALERKSLADIKDVLKTAVAFANSLPVGSPGVLYMPAKDDGSIQSANLDDLQKKVSSEIGKAYPRIHYNYKIIKIDSQQLLAVIIWGSNDRPHFAGPSYIRDGSETRIATEQQYKHIRVGPS